MSAPLVASSKLEIDHGARTTVWEGAGVDISHPTYKRERESGETAVVVFLDIDGYIDEVLGDLGGSNDVESLTRVIEALERVRGSLTAIYTNVEPRAGRCFAQGDWGRCERDSGHDGRHRLPEPPADYPSDASDQEVWVGSPVK